MAGTNKRWLTLKCEVRGGLAFTKTNLHKQLTNITYVGKVIYKGDVHAAEHPAIVDAKKWQRVQTQLKKNHRSDGELGRNKSGALLKSILHCRNCDCAMTPVYTAKKRK